MGGARKVRFWRGLGFWEEGSGSDFWREKSAEKSRFLNFSKLHENGIPVHEKRRTIAIFRKKVVFGPGFWTFRLPGRRRDDQILAVFGPMAAARKTARRKPPREVCHGAPIQPSRGRKNRPEKTAARKPARGNPPAEKPPAENSPETQKRVYSMFMEYTCVYTMSSLTFCKENIFEDL